MRSTIPSRPVFLFSEPYLLCDVLQVLPHNVRVREPPLAEFLVPHGSHLAVVEESDRFLCTFQCHIR